MEDSEAPHPGVEYADGPCIHGGQCSAAPGPPLGRTSPVVYDHRVVSRKNVLAALCAAATTLLFVPASPAAAAYAPRLLVTPSDAPGGALTVDLRAPVAERATARAVVYVPLGYRIGAPVAGEAIGKASATALDARGATVALAGEVVGATAADHAASSCVAGAPTVWLLQLSREGAQLRIPLLVAAAPAAASTIASSTITACWPSATAPEAAGLRLLSTTFALGAAALVPPAAPGTYRWRALVTPFTSSGSGESPEEAVESQSIVAQPRSVTAQAKLAVVRTPVDVRVTRTVNGKRVTVVERRRLITRYADITGTAREADRGITGSVVQVLGGTSQTAPRRLTDLDTGETGAFATRIQIDTSAPVVMFRLRLVAAVRELGAAACTPSFGPAVTCVGATAPPVRVDSAVVRLATGR